MSYPCISHISLLHFCEASSNPLFGAVEENWIASSFVSFVCSGRSFGAFYFSGIDLVLNDQKGVRSRGYIVPGEGKSREYVDITTFELCAVKFMWGVVHWSDVDPYPC